jgi:hypothetical protein
VIARSGFIAPPVFIENIPVSCFPLFFQAVSNAEKPHERRRSAKRPAIGPTHPAHRAGAIRASRQRLTLRQTCRSTAIRLSIAFAAERASQLVRQAQADPIATVSHQNVIRR